MDHAELIELTARAKAGDIVARNRVVEAYLALAWRIALKMRRRRPAALPLEDVAQEGSLGLIEAVVSWDPSLGSPFLTHAASRIEYAILRAWRRAAGHPDPVDPGEIDRMAATPDDSAARGEDGEVVRYALGRLRPRDREVLSLRYGLGGDRPLVYREVGHRLGCTKQAVSRRGTAALSRMRAMIEPGTPPPQPGHAARSEPILRALAAGPLHRRQIVARTGIDIEAIHDTLKILKRRGRVRIVSRGVWGLPECTAATGSTA